MCQENPKELEEENIDDYFDHGKNDIIFERYEKAIENLTKVIEFYKDKKYHSEDLFVAYYARGIAYKHLKKDIEAMRDFEKATELDRNSSEAHFNFTICYQKLFYESGEEEGLELMFKHAEDLKNGYKNYKNYFS